MTTVNFLNSKERDDGFAGYVAAINMSVEELVVGSPSCNLRFQLQWKEEEVHAIGAIFQEYVVFAFGGMLHSFKP